MKGGYSILWNEGQRILVSRQVIGCCVLWEGAVCGKCVLLEAAELHIGSLEEAGDTGGGC